MLIIVIICLLLLICLSSGNRQQIEPQATEPPRAIKKDAYKRFKTINAIKQEKQQKALYQELLKEFYIIIRMVAYQNLESGKGCIILRIRQKTRISIERLKRVTSHKEK